MIAALGEGGSAPPVTLWTATVEQLARLPWREAEFWLAQMTPGRNAVAYFLPLLLLLVWFPSRHTRLRLVLTGLAFVAYVFGPVYLVLWLLTCWVFYRLGERFAYEVRRTDVWRGGPPLAAFGLIVGHFVLVHALGQIKLPADVESWLTTHAAWLLPLGMRRAVLPWEPGWYEGQPILRALLWRTHEIGVAYFTIRMVSYFSEIKRGTIPAEKRTLLNFLAWLCYAPTLIQGPLERFNEFNAQIEGGPARRSWGDVVAGVGRVGLGVAKCFLAVALLYPVLARVGVMSPDFYRHPQRLDSYGLLFFGVHLQVLVLYLAFSGYCDFVIGLSRFIGYRVIENFDRPWRACSLTDMWRRWHISLSFILRDYIFFPLTRRRWNATLSLLITFLVCGVWHNLSGQYAAWGLVMGLLVAVNQKWSRWMRGLDRHPERPAARIRQAALRLQPLPKLCAWLLTINVFVMSGWVCFGGRGALRVGWELLRRPLQYLLAPWGVQLAPLG